MMIKVNEPKYQIRHQITWTISQLETLINIGMRFGTKGGMALEKSDQIVIGLVNPILQEAIEKLKEALRKHEDKDVKK